MKDWDKLMVLPLLAVLAATAPALRAAEVGWISDKLTVPLRSGPSNSHRILHRGLPSGTELTVLARDADSDFIEVRTSRGTQGWMPEQYLVDEPIARDRLVRANRRIEELNRKVEQQRKELAALNQGKSEADTSNSDLRRKLAATEQELAELKRISASAVALNDTNIELKELNGRLRDEVDELLASTASLEANAQQSWLMIGGGLVILGLLCGVAIKSRPRRSAWS